jgi:predicted ferric reductase
VICIAGGIGFTPFLCVIHNLMYIIQVKCLPVTN